MKGWVPDSSFTNPVISYKKLAYSKEGRIQLSRIWVMFEKTHLAFVCWSLGTGTPGVVWGRGGMQCSFSEGPTSWLSWLKGKTSHSKVRIVLCGAGFTYILWQSSRFLVSLSHHRANPNHTGSDVILSMSFSARFSNCVRYVNWPAQYVTRAAQHCSVALKY